MCYDKTIMKKEDKNPKIVKLSEFKKKKRKPFDVIEFARKKLLEDNPNNIKYIE